MRNRLMNLIDAFRELDVPHDGRTYTEHLADHLLASGVIVPPVKEGQTVYAVLFEGDEAKIYPWQVRGVARMQDKWYAVEFDGSEWEVGGAYCHLAEEIAEEYKKKKMEERGE